MNSEREQHLPKLVGRSFAKKELLKRLHLSRETLRILKDSEARWVFGGAPGTSETEGPLCPPT